MPLRSGNIASLARYITWCPLLCATVVACFDRLTAAQIARHLVNGDQFFLSTLGEWPGPLLWSVAEEGMRYPSWVADILVSCFHGVGESLFQSGERGVRLFELGCTAIGLFGVLRLLERLGREEGGAIIGLSVTALAWLAAPKDGDGYLLFAVYPHFLAELEAMRRWSWIVIFLLSALTSGVGAVACPCSALLFALGAVPSRNQYLLAAAVSILGILMTGGDTVSELVLRMAPGISEAQFTTPDFHSAGLLAFLIAGYLILGPPCRQPEATKYWPLSVAALAVALFSAEILPVFSVLFGLRASPQFLHATEERAPFISLPQVGLTAALIVALTAVVPHREALVEDLREVLAPLRAEPARIIGSLELASQLELMGVSLFADERILPNESPNDRAITGSLAGDYRELVGFYPKAQEVLKRWDFNAAIFPEHHPLIGYLRAHGWRTAGGSSAYLKQRRGRIVSERVEVLTKSELSRSQIIP